MYGQFMSVHDSGASLVVHHVLVGSPLTPTVSTFHLYTLDIEYVLLHDHLALTFYGEPSICIQASRPKDDEQTRIEDLFFYCKQLVKSWSEIPYT